MTSVLRQPLLHFLVAGAALFGLYEAVASEDVAPDDKTVVVDREALLTFLQYRSKAFDRPRFEEQLDGMSDDQLQRLVDDYVREEVLYREAVALGLGRDDYVIRRRMAQKVEFLTQGFAENGAALADAEVQAYYAANRSEYQAPAAITFAHVFFDAEEHGALAAQRAAIEQLKVLREQQARFDDAPRFGDRFLYHVNYVDRSRPLVRSHFGEVFAAEVFGLTADEASWHGPIPSKHGQHLVLVTAVDPGGEPPWAEIEAKVADDARRAAERTRTDAAIDDIVGTYDVRLEVRPARLRAPGGGAE